MRFPNFRDSEDLSESQVQTLLGSSLIGTCKPCLGGDPATSAHRIAAKPPSKWAPFIKLVCWDLTHFDETDAPSMLKHEQPIQRLSPQSSTVKKSIALPVPCMI